LIPIQRVHFEELELASERQGDVYLLCLLLRGGDVGDEEEED
jgi:hypothetical protein